jgi:hypothetical protein
MAFPFSKKPVPQVICPIPGSDLTLSDILTGIIIFGATGSGKTSGPGKWLALRYLAGGHGGAAGLGGLVLCAKPEERALWERLAKEAGRERDLIIVDDTGKHRFNFLQWEAERKSAGGGLSINVVAMLDEIASTVISSAGSASEGGAGDAKFFADSLHYLLINLVDICMLAGEPVSIITMRRLLNSAPLSIAQRESEKWQSKSFCYATLEKAGERLPKDDADSAAVYEECVQYFLSDFCSLSDRTRSVIIQCFGMLARPFLTPPLRRLFSTDTTFTPEMALQDGKIIIMDLPMQSHKLAGRMAQLAVKYAFQTALLRRGPGNNNPAFLWADEAQLFATKYDAEYQATARSAGGCTVYLTQNREGLRNVLGSDDAVDSLLGNLQVKLFCQNGSVDTNTWASRLLGERYVSIASQSVNNNLAADTNENRLTGGMSRSEQKRHYVEETEFAQLLKGGPVNNNLVTAIMYKGGTLFKKGEEMVPYTTLAFKQS